MSEANAGSDVVSMKCRADKKGTENKAKKIIYYLNTFCQDTPLPSVSFTFKKCMTKFFLINQKHEKTYYSHFLPSGSYYQRTCFSL